MRARWITAIAVVIAAFSAGAFFAPEPGARPSMEAGDLPRMKPFDGIRDIAPFSLVDHRGERFDRERLLGRWTLMTFGFTSCPDACPTMLTNFAELRKSLIASWQDGEPQFVFVSVDPARDTQNVLAQYVPSFDPAFIGATGKQAEIDRMHADIGGAHRLPPKAKTHEHADGRAHTHYNVDHSVLLYVINPQGRLHAQIAPPFDPVGVAGQIGRFARDFDDDKAMATRAQSGKV